MSANTHLPCVPQFAGEPRGDSNGYAIDLAIGLGIIIRVIPAYPIIQKAEVHSNLNGSRILRSQITAVERAALRKGIHPLVRERESACGRAGCKQRGGRIKR